MEDGSSNSPTSQHITNTSNPPKNALNNAYVEYQPWEAPGHKYLSDDSTAQETTMQGMVMPDRGSQNNPNLTSGPFEEDDITNQGPQPRENYRSRPIWSGIVDWVKGHDQDQSDMRPSTTDYTQVIEDPLLSHEKTNFSENMPEHPQRNENNGVTRSRAYTNTAAAAVHTFLDQNHDGSKYSAGV